ncbi:MAG: M23 family metallopeptidase [Clostridiales bacterium]|nr:M23 family metallopeptidase [Clostridiales bacterium]
MNSKKKTIGLMAYMKKQFLRKGIFAEGVLIVFGIILYCSIPNIPNTMSTSSLMEQSGSSTENSFIKWVDFQVSTAAMELASKYDIETYGTSHHVDWISLLAYAAAKSGGTFDKKELTVIKETAQAIENGQMTMDELTKDLKYYSYYQEAYEAALGGLLGTYQATDSTTQYGIKAFHPIAKTFPFSEYDDFGASRSYGYKRNHLGHDMMAQVGTPVIAIESGTVEALGWNQYGGWRIGIRSFDKKRYYYYAHLRKNYPYQSNLTEGCTVTAGDVIGYVGRTGYSVRENTNNIEVYHLHAGLELIFDESQKDSNNEIWIDLYPILRFLSDHQMEVKKKDGTKEWYAVNPITDPVHSSVP